MGITCLHSHTYYSDGICSPDELCRHADTIAITDHGTLAAHWFSSTTTRVLRGIEFYIDLPDDLSLERKKSKRTCHITVIADGEAGWKEIVKLNRLAWEQFYYVPRLRLDQLCGEHIVVLSGCPASPVARLFFAGRIEDAERVYRDLAARFRGRFFAEVQYGTEIQDTYSRFVVELAQRYGHTIVFTQDAHYTSGLYDVWRASRYGFDCKSLAIDRLVLPEGCMQYYANTCSLASGILPFSISESYIPEQTNESLLYIRKRISESHYREFLTESDLNRIEYEISVMQRCGVLGYIELADRVINIAKSVAGRAVVRGSVASSLVAFVLGWSEFHPDRYNLIFERFLSPQRKELPDVDIDVPARRRDDVIQELMKHYPLVYIATELRYAEKSARHQVERFIKSASVDVDIDEERLQNICAGLIGRVYGIGVHASGLAILPDNIASLVPVRVVDKKLVCEWSMNNLPTVKLDLLGQKTLDVIIHCEVPSCASVLDKDVVDSTARNTVGVFQLEGAMRRYARWCMRRGHPVNYIISMYRPAIINSGILMMTAKGEQVSVDITNDEMNVCHHGFPVYQEDLLRILSHNGIPLEDAYTILKIAAKKDRDKLAKYLSERNLNISDRVVRLCEFFSEYAFNMAHAAAYAQRAWQTAWARYYRPERFWPIMIDSESDDVMRACYVMAAARIYRVLPPDARSWNTRVVGNDIILGMGIVPNYTKHGKLIGCDGINSVDELMKMNNKKNRDVLVDSELLNYLSGRSVDIVKMRRYLRVPCMFTLTGNNMYDSLSDVIDSVIEDALKHGRSRRVTNRLFLFGDGKRVTDGTEIVWLNGLKPFEVCTSVSVELSSSGDFRVWCRLKNS